jgi:cell wall-associated NlpC family hydrolase
MIVSHVRASRRQQLKHQVQKRMRHLHRVAAVAATVGAAAAPAASARADQVRTPRVLPSNPGVADIPATMPGVSPTQTGPRQGKIAPVQHNSIVPQVSHADTTDIPTSIATNSRYISLRGLPATGEARLTSPADYIRPTPAFLASRTKTSPYDPNSLQKPDNTTPSPKTAEEQRVLLAQLDAQLRDTEAKLKTADDKLSEGQRQLMGLSTTLRSVMLEEGENAIGLHPFVRVAARYAGTPYVWGGESRYGFDCSGFIIRVMRDLGYPALPHSAAEQFKYGEPVAQSLLKPGDLVFFANTYKPGISHVGIYIGKRRFIHAASTRQGTIVSCLDDQPYARKYAGARRLLTYRRKA